MNIYVDVDNTITKTVGMDYENAEPVFKKISIIDNFSKNLLLFGFFKMLSIFDKIK